MYFSHAKILPAGSFCFSVLFGLLLIGCNEPDSTNLPSGDGPDRNRITEPDLAASVVGDDAFVIFVTGNWQENLEPCGCSDQQLGGIDRRSHLLNVVPPQRRLLIDAGGLINHDSRQSQLKLETFLYSLKQLGYDAVSLTGSEIILLNEVLALTPDQLPPLVVSNMSESAQAEFSAVSSYRKTLKNKNHSLDCLILGLTDPAEITGSGIADRLQLTDPLESVQEKLIVSGVEPSQSSPDVLIIVTLSSTNDILLNQLQQIAAIDLIVSPGYTDEAEIVSPDRSNNFNRSRNPNKPLVVTPGKMGKYLARFMIAPEGPATLQAKNFTAIPVFDHFPKDPEIVKFIDTYQLQLQVEDLIRDELARPRQALPEGLSFAGSESCAAADCHADIYKNWKEFGHAWAMPTLVKAKRQFDPECVQCHTVGMNYIGGYLSMEQTPQFAAVGCENCHGPGSKHNEEPFEPYQEVFTPCEQCHNSEQSPEFELHREEFFSKIQHWPDGERRYWK
ncbi:MAG: hypothetical protein JXD22_10790 [Sedimentisphaerales bacterium]|nr:hypothetical protein [Sedimentisphaerales bacterium]